MKVLEKRVEPPRIVSLSLSHMRRRVSLSVCLSQTLKNESSGKGKKTRIVSPFLSHRRRVSLSVCLSQALKNESSEKRKKTRIVSLFLSRRRRVSSCVRLSEAVENEKGKKKKKKEEEKKRTVEPPRGRNGANRP